MPRPVLFLSLLALTLPACSSPPATPNPIFFIPGVAGDGPWYDDLRRGLADANIPDPLTTVSWGAPPPFTILNFQDRSIHNKAEEKLAHKITDWLAKHPAARIRVLAHSAGCGVALGALARLPSTTQIDQLVLLSPSVCPQYDLTPAAQHVRFRIHVFSSQKDTLLLGWRCRTFGTYDNIKSEAAGKLGFSSIPNLPPDLQQKIIPHPHDPGWESLKNDGAHFGPTARPFATTILAPLLK